jgi:hypothetical protein
MLKIIIIILILITLLYFYNYQYGIKLLVKEEFDRVRTIQPINQDIELNVQPIRKYEPNEVTQDINAKRQISKKVLFDTKDYNEALESLNKDLTYYDNDVIDQAKINETAFNIVYQIDKIDYADVKTGIEKCNERCDGVCFEMGYTGTSTCYPRQTRSFDWGTLYKNPTFTYGFNAYGPENLRK